MLILMILERVDTSLAKPLEMLVEESPAGLLDCKVENYASGRNAISYALQEFNHYREGLNWNPAMIFIFFSWVA